MILKKHTGCTGVRAAGGLEEEGTKKTCFEKKSKQAKEKKLCYRGALFRKGTRGLFSFLKHGVPHHF